jgi:hypothetical protein
MARFGQPAVHIAEVKLRCPEGYRTARVVGPTASEAIRRALALRAPRCVKEEVKIVKRGRGVGIDLGALDWNWIQGKPCPRAGTRVVFNPSPGARFTNLAPPRGARGTIVAQDVGGGRGPRTCAPRTGSGVPIVYVRWDSEIWGVGPNDIDVDSPPRRKRR